MPFWRDARMTHYRLSLKELCYMGADRVSGIRGNNKRTIITDKSILNNRPDIITLDEIN